jgi:hypothetical protein
VRIDGDRITAIGPGLVAPDAEVIDATGATGPVRVLGDWQANSLDFSGTSFVGNVVINGGGGNDTITGSAGNDTIEVGGWGNQTIDGGAGDDTIYADGQRHGQAATATTPSGIGQRAELRGLGQLRRAPAPIVVFGERVDIAWSHSVRLTARGTMPQVPPVRRARWETGTTRSTSAARPWSAI